MRTIVVLAACSAIFIADRPVLAHESITGSLPDEPGWRLDAEIATFAARADDPWPAAHWPGVLVNGGSFRDQRHGVRLEHGKLALAARLDERVGGLLAVGWHDREAAHVEAAGLLTEWGFDAGRLSVSLGRGAVRLGQVIDEAWDLDAFAQPPLSKRAVLNDQWIDDGLTARWQPSRSTWGVHAIEVGLLRGRAFPAGAEGPAIPTLQLASRFGAVDVDLFFAHLEPAQRGAERRSVSTVGHSHGMPDCSRVTAQVICFDGRSDVLSGSLRWQPAHSTISADLAGLMRRDRGAIYSTSGEADYRGTIQGGWLQLGWQFRPQWQMTGRFERLVTRHVLDGNGTALLALEGGLSGAAPMDRLAASVQYRVSDAVTVGFELGREGGTTGTNTYGLIRLVLQQSYPRAGAGGDSSVVD